MKKTVLLFVTLLVLLSCNKSKSSFLFEVHEVDFVNKSEATIKGVPIDAEWPLDIHYMGVCDSFLLVKCGENENSLWVYSDDYELIGRFCAIGRARNEFLSSPRWYSTQVLRSAEGDAMIPLVCSGYGLKLMNLQKSLETQSTVIDKTSDYDGLNVFEIVEDHFRTRFSPVSRYMFLDNTIDHIFEKKLSVVYDDVIYSEGSFDVIHDTAVVKQFKLLADFGVNDHDYMGGDLNKHPDRNLIIHPFYYLDYILFFDIDNDRTFAIHQKGSLSFDDGLPVIPEERIKHFSKAACTDSFFMVTYFAGNAAPELLFFDWDGKFLKSVKVDTEITDITYDERKQVLYGLDEENDRILCFDLSLIIKQLSL